MNSSSLIRMTFLI